MRRVCNVFCLHQHKPIHFVLITAKYNLVQEKFKMEADLRFSLTVCIMHTYLLYFTDALLTEAVSSMHKHIIRSFPGLFATVVVILFQQLTLNHMKCQSASSLRNNMTCKWHTLICHVKFSHFSPASFKLQSDIYIC